MINEYPIQFELSNGTRVLVNRTGHTYDFHLTRLIGMKHNFTWTNTKGISDAETATALPRESFTAEESEAISIFKAMQL